MSSGFVFVGEMASYCLKSGGYDGEESVGAWEKSECEVRKEIEEKSGKRDQATGIVRSSGFTCTVVTTFNPPFFR